MSQEVRMRSESLVDGQYPDSLTEKNVSFNIIIINYYAI